MKKRMSFFVHHQGRGHANRAKAIIERLSVDRPVSVLTADPGLFDGFERDIDIVELPDMIGAAPASQALFEVPTPSVLHCAPAGVEAMRTTMRRILDHLDDSDCGLFVVDVSAEISLLARIASVPVVKVRMHGDRNDPGHLAAYDSCVGMLAPYDEEMEQEDYPDWARAKTHYTGGLCTSSGGDLGKQTARQQLGLPLDQEIVVVMTGGGGAGTPYAPLTVAARALPQTLFLTLGPLHREGHETDFANLLNLGWVDHAERYLAAADMVIASAGDNTVHEIARAGRPYLCAPEWRYFSEQQRKAERLEQLGAAICLSPWPGDVPGWQRVFERARHLDVSQLHRLHDSNAACHAADWLQILTDHLWQETGEAGCRLAVV